jgi:transposase InsO family protein
MSVELLSNHTTSEASMHRNAPLTPEGRRRLCELIAAGWTVAAAAESMRISRQCAHKWWRRYLAEGLDGLVDRSSRPKSCPHQTPARVERRIVALREARKLGPARLGGLVGMHPSTVHRVLVRHHCNRLAWMDRVTGRVVRRIETHHCGELVHIDIKKLSRIPRGGGWRVNGKQHRLKNGQAGRPRLGYAFVHSAIDAHSRLAYSEIHPNEQGRTAVEFWRRAHTFFEAHHMTVERVLTDNGSCYRSNLFAQTLHERGIIHTFTRPYRPATNGKVERFNRTLLDEWAYARAWRSDNARTRGLDQWLHRYNHHRHHTAIGGPPIGRVTNLPGQNS